MTNNAPDEQEPENHEDEPALGTMLGVEDDDIVQKNKGVGIGFVFLGFVIASLAGGFMGIVGPRIFQHPGQTQQLRNEVRAELDALTQSTNEQDKAIKTLMARLQKHQSLIAKLETRDAEILTSLKNQQENIATHIERISSVDKPGGGSGGGGGDNQPDPNVRQDDIVETLTPDAPEPGDNVGMPQTSLQTSLQASLDVLVETFPRKKLLAAVKAQEALAQKKPGWLRRTLRKHVNVRDKTTPDPYAVIDAAEAALKQGRVQDALDNIARLNPTIRAAAADWVKAAKKTL